MTFYILTIFKDAMEPYLNASLIGKARAQGTVRVEFVDLRDFTDDAHRTVDDKPYGGGPGMVLMVEPIYRALEHVKGQSGDALRTLLLSPRGTQFTAAAAQELSAAEHVALICGRYEGVDERVAEHLADDIVSIGPYVLSGGELPALVVVEAVSRYIPGVIGKEESREEIKGSYPVYTRPEKFVARDGDVWEVPEVLRSGSHENIREWRERHGGLRQENG